MTTFKQLIDAPSEVLVIHKTLVKALGFSAAVFMSRLHFWLNFNASEGRSATHFRRGKWWTYNTVLQWVNDIEVLSERSVERVIASLEELELIEADNFNGAAYDRTKWYTINYEACEQFLALWRECGEPTHGKGSDARNAFLARWKEACESAARGDLPRQDGGNDTDNLEESTPPTWRISFRQVGGMKPAKLAEPIPVVSRENTEESSAAPRSVPAEQPSAQQPPAAARRKTTMIAPNPYAEVEPTMITGTDSASKGGSERDDISDHALYQWLVKVNGGKPLPKATIKALQQKNVVPGAHGSTSIYPNLLDMYDTVQGFRLFCEESLDMFIRTRNGQGVKVEHLVSFLRDFSNAKNGTALRWFAWAERNPEQCKSIEAQAQETAEQKANRLLVERIEREAAESKAAFDARWAESNQYRDVETDDGRPEHLRGLRTWDEWEYYIRHGLTLADQHKLAATGELAEYRTWR